MVSALRKHPVGTYFALTLAITSSDRTGLILPAIAYGLVGGLVEGNWVWTGFAIPRLRARFSVLATGLIVGVVWGVWHMLQMWWVGSTSFEAVAAVARMAGCRCSPHPESGIARLIA